MYTIVVSDENQIFTGSERVWQDIPDNIAKIMMNSSEDSDDNLLSWLSYCSEDVFEDDELNEINKEVKTLIERQLLTQQEVQKVLELIQFAIDNNRRIMFTPFWHMNIPSQEM